jgi:catechol 2,3-dioxygenase-like lactoylglutathione lyase family enzyme
LLDGSAIIQARRGSLSANTFSHQQSEETIMAKLRHIAIAVADIEAAAKFYEQAFEMKRVRQSKMSIHLTDGVVNMAILDNRHNHEALGHEGLHHLGFIVDDVAATGVQAESMGAVYADKDENIAARQAIRGTAVGGDVLPEAMRMEQRKFRDPNRINFDIVNAEHARLSWHIPG